MPYHLTTVMFATLTDPVSHSFFPDENDGNFETFLENLTSLSNLGNYGTVLIFPNFGKPAVQFVISRSLFGKQYLAVSNGII